MQSLVPQNVVLRIAASGLTKIHHQGVCWECGVSSLMEDLVKQNWNIKIFRKFVSILISKKLGP